MDPKILAQNEHGNRRIVELEATHEIDRDGTLSLIYTASMTEGGVTLHRISGADAPTHFYLDANVMNALAAGWAKFQEDMEARIRAEDEQRQALIAEAYAIAARHPEIKIESDGTTSSSWWRVSCPSQGVAFRQPAYYPAQLLEQIKECVAFLPEPAIGGDAA